VKDRIMYWLYTLRYSNNFLACLIAVVGSVFVVSLICLLGMSAMGVLQFFR
jgi:hypothetical protein